MKLKTLLNKISRELKWAVKDRLIRIALVWILFNTFIFYIVLPYLGLN